MRAYGYCLKLWETNNEERLFDSINSLNVRYIVKQKNMLDIKNLPNDNNSPNKCKNCFY